MSSIPEHMNKIALASIVLVSIAIGTWLGLKTPSSTDANGRYAKLGGDFTLQGESGEISLKDYEGKVVALYFGYTRCPDVCITSLSKLAMGLKGLSEEERARIQAIFVSIDPERDTPAIADNYMKFFYPDGIGLSGTPEEIAEVAGRYRVIYEKVVLEDSAMPYSVDHSSIIYVIGADGRISSLVQHADDATAVAAALREALSSPAT